MAVSSDNYGPAAKAPIRSRYARAGSTAAASSRGIIPINDDDLESNDRIQLSGNISVVRMHQLSITLRPLARNSSSGGRTVRLTASRWEIRKAITSLCCTQPTSMEVSMSNLSRFKHIHAMFYSTWPIFLKCVTRSSRAPLDNTEKPYAISRAMSHVLHPVDLILSQCFL